MARILLVDDEYLVVYALARLLKSNGYDVSALYEGNLALPRLKQSGRYDLLLVDLRMAPVDGLELIRRARQYQPAMPIVVISAYLDSAMLDRIEELGVSTYVRKPFQAEDVLSAVEEALGGEPSVAKKN